MEPDLAFPTARCTLNHQHLVGSVGNALVLFGFNGFDDDLQLPVLCSGLTQCIAQSLARCLRRGR